jgi:hypothetical protein
MHEEPQLSQSEGPSPTDVDDDEGEATEDLIADMDRYEGAEDHTTALEQLEGDTIDDRTRREQPQRVRPDTSIDLIDDDGGDGVDREKDLVGESEQPDGPIPAELEAMHVVDGEPGVVDHPDDYVED